MYTLSDLQEQIHRTYVGDNNTPSTGSEDYVLRLELINDAIKSWGGLFVGWAELFTDLSDASTGDKTTVAGQTKYDAPDDFQRMVSFVQVDGGTLVFKPVDSINNEMRTNAGGSYYYITGNPSVGYSVNLSTAPSDTGLTIGYQYYKYPSLVYDSSDIPEVPNSMFIVYFVLARLHEQDGRSDLTNFYEEKADEVLDQMKARNILPPHFHPFTMRDVSYQVNGTAFGV